MLYMGVLIVSHRSTEPMGCTKSSSSLIHSLKDLGVNLFGVNLLYPSSTVVKFPVFVVGDPFPWSSTGVNLRLRLRQDLEIRGFSEINFGRSAHAAGFYAVSRYGRGTANWRNIRRYIHTISIYGYGKLYSGGTGALEVYTKYKGIKMIHLIIFILFFVHEMVIE